MAPLANLDHTSSLLFVPREGNLNVPVVVVQAVDTKNKAKLILMFIFRMIKDRKINSYIATQSPGKDFNQQDFFD